MNGRFRGMLTEKEEFLYPDSPLGELPQEVRLVMPLNGQPGLQLLLETGSEAVAMSLEGQGLTARYYNMEDVPVEYNTGDGEIQGGAMVLVDRPSEKPDYAVRLAPFRVYDCLERREDGRIPVRQGRAAVYVCFRGEEGLTPGEHRVTLRVLCREGEYRCLITVKVYEVIIPENTFYVTNWFSREAICRFHHVDMGSEAYLSVLEKYIGEMRRIHQNVFFIQLEETCIVSRSPYAFDFEYLTPEIERFFEAGMSYMELGVLLDRGTLPDGKPDMYTGSFTCAMAKDVPADSLEGYEITVRFVRSLADYLKKHGWEERVLFHIHDEPDIHFRDLKDLESRRKQYYLAAGILRKYIPGVRIIEAVDSARFMGGIDILVPGTCGYEKKKEEFDKIIDIGDTLWTYVCCGPEGHWLNRFLDFALIKGRLLFWGCAKNRISGFLHWGLNQFQMGMNPYEGTSCPNHTGIGTNFPCGDSFIIYPGEEGPKLGMRMEAQRRGAEDAALWQLLRRKDPLLHDRLIGRVYTNNYTYNDDPGIFARVYEDLLGALEGSSPERIPGWVFKNTSI